MKILVVGGGGREHALCWRLRQSSGVDKVYCAPGNAGIREDAECVDIRGDDLQALAGFAEKNSIDLTVVGPEAPLCAGLVDLFASRGLPVFGPSREAARLEGSKCFSKDFMKRHGIPTAAAESFVNKKDALEHLEGLRRKGAGAVVKADGLAAGKGVIVAPSIDEARAGVEECFGGAFGDAGKKVLIERLLIGEETSILAFTDGKSIVPLVPSQDHKRVGDGDTGPNTGGMGAYCPAPVVTQALASTIKTTILDKVLAGIRKDCLSYKGIIYAGVMVTPEGPLVLEFNVRFGDPETQAVMALMDGDLADVMLKTASGRLDEAKVACKPGSAVCVVMAAGGYPGHYEKGHPISGLEDAQKEGAVVFHAGTSLDKQGRIVTSGGRVLGVTAVGSDIRKAVQTAYAAAARISWQGSFHRKDIAARAIARL